MWVVTLAAFGLFRAGVPSPVVDAQVNAQLGQGEPATWQYLHYLLRLLHGNLGESLTVGLPVSTVVSCAAPAILPVMASVGAGFGVLLGSAAIADQVFALGGIGQALLTAVKQGDLMVVMGVVLVTVILISLVNLIADLCQAALDPQMTVT